MATPAAATTAAMRLRKAILRVMAQHSHPTVRKSLTRNRPLAPVQQQQASSLATHGTPAPPPGDMAPFVEVTDM